MSLENEIAAANLKAVDQWRETVFAAAAGDEPSLPALTKLAESLGITVTEAHAKFRQDVGIVQMRNSHLAHRSAAQARADKMLEPFGGCEREFRASVESAESVARELRTAYNTLVSQTLMSVGMAEGSLRRLEASRADLFPTPTISY
jgi:hypothetical protein